MTVHQLHPPGSVYPPRSHVEIEAYDPEHIVAGYLEHRTGDPIPGPNHAPGYRWGATNRARDEQIHDDGFDHIRRSYLQARRNRA